MKDSCKVDVYFSGRLLELQRNIESSAGNRGLRDDSIELRFNDFSVLMCAALAVHCLIHWLVSTSCLFAFVCFVHVWLHSRSSSGSPHPGRPAMADGERSRRSCESEARRRSATTEGRLRVSQSLSPWEMEKSPKTSKTKTLLSQWLGYNALKPK